MKTQNSIRGGRFFLTALVLVFLAGSVLANDWLTSGKGGSSGKLAPEKVEAAWKGLTEYKTGDDQGALLAMEWVVIDSINKPEVRKVTAARLATLLEKPGVSYDAKCFICAMLFRCGTPAEVKTVAKLFDDPKTADIARLYFERVPSDEANKVLRNALDKLAGKRESIGVMNSLSIRKDKEALPKIIALTKSSNKEITLAAWRAVSNFCCDKSADFLIDSLKKCQYPNVPMEAAAIRVAAFTKNDAKRAEIYKQLGMGNRAQGARQAVALYNFEKADKATQEKMTAEWVKSNDNALLKLAARQILNLNDASLEKMSKQNDISVKFRILIIEELAQRQGEKMVPSMLENAKSKDLATAQMAIRFLGNVNSTDSRILPVLVKALNGSEEIAKIAADALAKRNTEDVGPALLDALNNNAANRDRLVVLLSKLKYYKAIDPLTKLARNADPAVYEGAVEGLRGICDPDQPDLKRMFDLYLDVKNEKQRDFIARAIAYIAEKNADKVASAKILLACVDSKKNKSAAYDVIVLPLIGRIGGIEVYKRVEAGLKSSDANVAAAAVRALCNWPTAEYADTLWSIVDSNNKVFANQALRAYIRVVTLPNKRSEAETLAMLQKAMKAADNDANKKLALSRASVVRTLDTVRWAVGYLDDVVLAETACKVIVELAHHRFLRQPNKAFFEPILLKVEKTAKNRTVAEQAAKARMGM